jgi:uncharacterized protein
MRRCFFDTSAYIALTDASDEHHAEATTAARAIAAARLPRVTTNYILAETYTRTRRLLGHTQAVWFGTAIARDITAGALFVVYVDAALDQAAWALFRQFADQPFSFVDCASFAWIRQQRDVEVVAFNYHFWWMGCRPFQPDSVLPQRA